MIVSVPQRIGRALGSRSALHGFLLYSTLATVGLIWSAWQLTLSPHAAVTAFLICVLLGARGLITTYPHRQFGACNAVTLGRAALTAFLLGGLFEAQAIESWLVFWIAVLAFSLDGVDGWLARRSGLSSGFGARFDMETDAALGAVLALWLLLSGTTGPEILVLGFLRYVFIAAGWFVPALTAELPPSFRRKAICVVQIASLIFLICPLAPEAFLLPVSLAASALLLYSFAIDTHWLVKLAR